MSVILTPINTVPWQVLELAAADAPPQQPPQQPPQSEPVADAAVVAAVLAAIAALLAAGGAAVTAKIAAQLVRLGIRSNIAQAVAARFADPAFPSAAATGATTGPAARGQARPSATTRNAAGATTGLKTGTHAGTASKVQARTNLVRRAQYLVNAARRVTQDVVAGAPLVDALEAERANWQAHQAATEHRAEAARKVDQAAAVSRKLRWTTAHDDRVTPDCAALDGRVFDVAKPPGGKYPGTVHPRCRCTAVPVTSTAQLSKEITMSRPALMRMPDGSIVDAAGPLPVTVTPARRDLVPHDRASRVTPHPVAENAYDADALYGPEVLPPSPDTLDLIKYLRTNNPYMFGAASSDIAATIESADRVRLRAGQGFDAAGQRGWHDQMPLGGYETNDRAFARPGENEIERRNRVAEQDLLRVDAQAEREAARKYAHQHGLV